MYDKRRDGGCEGWRGDEGQTRGGHDDDVLFWYFVLDDDANPGMNLYFNITAKHSGLDGLQFWYVHSHKKGFVILLER